MRRSMVRRCGTLREAQSGAQGLIFEQQAMQFTFFESAKRDGGDGQEQERHSRVGSGSPASWREWLHAVAFSDLLD